MPVWTRHRETSVLSTAGTHDNKELIHNNPTTANPWEASRLVVVDGFVTLHTDTDDFCGARFVVMDENIVDADFDENAPEDPDDAIYYSFWAVRGPQVYRLNSAKTIFPNEKLWLTVWKDSGSTSTTIHCGMRLFIHQKF